MNVEHLIIQLQNKDEQAYKELVFTYTKRLMSVARLYDTSVQDAQDNLQETFVTVFNKIHEFKGKGEGQLYSWMKQILIYKSLNKNQRKYKQTESSLDHVEHHTVLDADALSQLSHQEIIDIVRNLPLGYREVFALYAIEGFSHKEIGERMGIAASSSRSQYSRAKKILQKRIHELSKVYQ